VLDLRARELRREGRKLRLPDKPFEILAALLEDPGEVITRAELRRRLWSDGTFVDFDHNVNNAVNRLRETLNDSADDPRFVETVPRLGYRFIAPVHPVVEPGQETFGAPPPQPSRLARWRFPLVAATLLAMTAASYLVWQRLEPSGEASPGRVLLLVLPFENLSGDPAWEYLSDGFTEELIARLGRLNPERMGVIARTSAMAYKRTTKPVGQIAREMGVNYVVEGSLRRSGHRLRITAQLIRTDEQSHLWGGNYDRTVSDYLTLQAEVSQEIARQVQVQLTPSAEARLVGSRPVIAEAYELYLKSRWLWHQFTTEAFQECADNLEKAVRLDPSYAPAFATLAGCYTWIGYVNALPPRLAYERARAAAGEALRLDESLADAHVSMGYVRLNYDWDFPAAERDFRKAIELNPDSPEAHYAYGVYLWKIRGQMGEAVREFRRALELDPFSKFLEVELAWSLRAAGESDEAEERFRGVVALDPSYGEAHVGMGILHMDQGKVREAVIELEKAVALPGGKDRALGSLGAAYAAAGEALKAREAHAELKRRVERGSAWPSSVALLSLALEDDEEALRWLELGYRQRSSAMICLRDEFQRLRNDPRFQDLLHRMGFPAPDGHLAAATRRPP
jgi:TolB-like protein/DNA-binding winged helix-turn-helix (wHTH) protein/Tfp pilus assembly protein PilF